MDREQVLQGKQCFVAGTDVGKCQDARNQRQQHDQNAEGVIYIRDQTLHRMCRAPDQQGNQYADCDRRREQDDRIWQVWPAEPK